MGGFMGKITRKVPLESISAETSLHRCLTTWDLTLLGLGGMIGSGIYVMMGQACRETSGPSLVISFVLAAMIILMVAGCFTELAARVQKTGSTYLYMYIVLGELPAFLLGFSTLVLGILGGATNARAWSAYFDSLLNGTIADFTMSVTGQWGIGEPVAEYPDLVALMVMLILTVIVALGAKCQSWINSAFVILNIMVLLFIIIVGFIYADMTNWTNPDTGGFFPFGFSGVIEGAAVCFWAFSGFELLSSAVEEAKEPRKGLAIATVLSLFIVTVLYVGTTAALTLVTPYNQIDVKAPLPSAFAAKGLPWAQYVVAIGPLCGLTTTLMACLYGSVRTAYKMSEDGLLFAWLSAVADCSKVPVLSVVVHGSLMSLTALFFDVNELINFSVILILGSYAFVCACVIVLRYTPNPASCALDGQSAKECASSESRQSHITISRESFEEYPEEDPDRMCIDNQNGSAHTTRTNNVAEDDDEGFDPAFTEDSWIDSQQVVPGGLKRIFFWLWPCNMLKPGSWTSIAVILICVSMILAAIMSVYFEQRLISGTWWTIVLFTLSLMLVLALLITVYFHKQSSAGLIVRMPCVPLLPTVGMCCCLYMVVSLAKPWHWIGVAVLFLASLLIYFAYSIRYSKLNNSTYSSLLRTSSSSDTAALIENNISSEDEL